jgi:hypothetical protein
VGRFLAESDLDACGAPGDEGCESALADTEEGFVDLDSNQYVRRRRGSWEVNYIGRISLALDDVENGDVATALGGICEDHTVLGLQKATHNI